jgi:hypothetical protein
MQFDLFSQIQTELYDFFNTKVHLAGTKSEGDARFLTNNNKNFEFSQWEMVNLIDLYYNSKFESGMLDSEGQRKLFLNICKFRSDVASKQIDLDVKDFQFLPEDADSEWGAFLMSKEFKYWAKENYFGELLNTCVENFPKYGWLVLKEVKGKLEFVPLQTLRNQQDAESLETARFVTIEHPAMTLDEMQAMKGWDTNGIDMKFGETTKVFERYGFVPLAAIKQHNGEKVTDEDYKTVVDSLSIVMLDDLKDKNKPNGNVLFFEQISKRPFVEGHWTKLHGRLMGVGEIENQLENQVGMNMAFNLFRRNLLYSSKKVWQTAGEDVAKNLVRDVKDGSVLEVGPNGAITPVDMTNRSTSDYNSFMNALDSNSDKKSFTYEAATGESMNSGTPFRLGVLLSNAVNSHFELKREKLGLILKRAVVSKIVPSFKKSNTRKHIVSMFADEEGFEALKMAALNVHLNDSIKQHLLQGEVPDVEALKAKVTDDLNNKRFMYVDVPDSFYDDINYKLTLTVTGEEVDLPKKIETLTNLYTSLAQAGDPRANKVLSRIMGLTGENFDILAGPAPAPTPPPVMQGAQPSPIQPSTLNQPAQSPTTL